MPTTTTRSTEAAGETRKSRAPYQHTIIAHPPHTPSTVSSSSPTLSGKLTLCLPRGTSAYERTTEAAGLCPPSCLLGGGGKNKITLLKSFRRIRSLPYRPRCSHSTSRRARTKRSLPANPSRWIGRPGEVRAWVSNGRAACLVACKLCVSRKNRERERETEKHERANNTVYPAVV